MEDDAEIEASLLLNEDAPQVVGVIDERPPELKALDYKNKLWKGLNEVEDRKLSASSSKGQSSRGSGDDNRRKERKRSEDLSPKRSRRKSADLSPQRARRERASDDDLSPKRPRNRRGNDDDLSPQRASRRNRTPDISPPRRRNGNERDLSPKRRKKSRFRDASPVLEYQRKENSPYVSPTRIRKDLDLSPVRKGRERSPNVSHRTEPTYRSPDLSPTRRNRKRTPSLSPRRARMDLDLSPERNRRPRKYSRSPRRRPQTPDISPPRFRNIPSRKASESPPPTHGKMKRTMDGKMAGLQDANKLKMENAKHSKRESEMYEKMTEEMSGRNAEAKVRATGAIDRRKLEANLAKEREKEEKYAERKQIYDKWGKGVKQLEDYKEHLELAARDASKPFARYAGDEDVERHLKEQERLEDPMLNYIRSKRKKQEVKEKVPTKPVYKGLFPDNRFNIRPGYRWDGVDRSNGYEKRHFEAINVRKASQEEAYLYSTEDM